MRDDDGRFYGCLVRKRTDGKPPQAVHPVATQRGHKGRAQRFSGAVGRRSFEILTHGTKKKVYMPKICELVYRTCGMLLPPYL